MRTQRRKTKLDAEVNLTPFIDLLSMCICFLLATSVWLQIAAIEVRQSVGESSAKASRYEIELAYSGKTSMSVAFRRDGKTVGNRKITGKDPEDLLELLGKQLEESLEKYISQTDQKSTGKDNLGSLISAARITPFTTVAYGNLVGAMDVLRRHRISHIGVVPWQG